MAEEQDQNRSEAPTPFKLRKARERGSVARSTELGFIAGLLGLAAFALVAGPAFLHMLMQTMRLALSGSFSLAGEPQEASALLGKLAWTALAPVALFGMTLMAIAVLLELVQLRGFIFTAQPLKPDFSRMNPAKGLKRLFSMRLLKETLKSIAKMIAYSLAAWLIVRSAVARYGTIASDGDRLAEAMAATATQLLFAFLGIAIAFAILDQLLVRGEFLKQMRMSRREVTKESRDREGEPRIKRRRKQLHAELVAQGKGLGALAGSDLLIVNPEHFAIALRYDEAEMMAPTVATKGRNAIALKLRAEAFRLGVPIIANPPLARALFRGCAVGAQIPPEHFENVAAIYIDLHRARLAPEPA